MFEAKNITTDGSGLVEVDSVTNPNGSKSRVWVDPRTGARTRDVTEPTSNDPVGMAYTGPDGQRRSVGNVTPFLGASYNKDGSMSNPGRESLSYALSDPTSDLSNLSYYGGSRGYSNDEYARQSGMAYDFNRRGAIQADLGQANASAGYQTELANNLQRAAAGDPNSVAQQQLASSYGAAGQSALSAGNSARGGLAARANALRTAGNAGAATAGSRDIASIGLMARERQAALGQLSGLSSAMRSGAQGEAFGQAGLAQQSRAVNSAAEFAARNRGLHAAQQGLAGEMNRQQTRREVMSTNIGIQNRYDDADRARADRNMNTALATGQSAASGFGGLAASYNSGGDKEQTWQDLHPEYNWNA